MGLSLYIFLSIQWLFSGTVFIMNTTPDLDQLSAEQLRLLAAQLMDQVAQKDRKIVNYSALNEKLTHELAILKRHKYSRTSEALALDQHQASLLDELMGADIAAIEEELAGLDAPESPKAEAKKKPKREPLPAEFPRTVIEHEPDNTLCACGCQLKRIGEDISEKLDYIPGVFTVERHVRGKWACTECETITQAPVPAQVIDKGIPTSGLLAQVLIAKFSDHLPLYRQEHIFARAGLAIARSSLADWVGRCGVALQPLVDAMRDALLSEAVLHADETPVPMLKPGNKKTHKAYIWAYASTPFSPLSLVVYDFAPSRAGANPRSFLDGWEGQLVCDDYSGYKASFKQGIIEIGCFAHARRKFFDLHASNKSQIAEYALIQISKLYEVERLCKNLNTAERETMRQEKAKPILDGLHQWLLSQRQKVPNGSAIAKAIDYSLNRWSALIRYCEDGAVPIDNNWIENQMRPWALGRKNWLFAGSLRGGQRGAGVMSLIQSAKLNGHEPYAYLSDVLNRLPTQKNSQIGELLPHNWTSSVNM